MKVFPEFPGLNTGVRQQQCACHLVHFNVLRTEQGRRLEVEGSNCTVVSLGREQGVDTPLNIAVYAALKPYENGGLATPRSTSVCGLKSALSRLEIF